MSPAPLEWFERRTYHHRQFADPSALLEAKRARGETISVCIPTRNEEETIGPIVSMLRRELVERVPLVDELVIIDSKSSDRTTAIADEAGAAVYQEREVLPGLEPKSGKGEAMWKSLFVLRGDIVAWLDADIKNIHPRFVYGILGPLLTDPTVGYVKGFYDRPVQEGKQVADTGGGRVTELLARPVLNMFWPHLAGLIQPLAGEYAGRRRLLEQVPFFTGYGVEIGLVIDVAERFGLDAIAQVDLERRVHRNRTITELARMSFAVLQAAMRRLASTERITFDTALAPALFQFERHGERIRMEPAFVDVQERPPAATVAGYGAAR